MSAKQQTLCRHAALLFGTFLSTSAIAQTVVPTSSAKPSGSSSKGLPVVRTAKPKPPAVPSSNDAEAVIVTGTRSSSKRAYQSLSPIDVVSAADLRRTGGTDVRDALVRTIPSISRQTSTGNADSGGLTDAIRLRGLNPDDVLVLVDGKRRHTTANIYIDPGLQQGSTPVDLDMIPMSAIDHIEVLRDGAAAQYGSDAVAGVVNIILKKSDHGSNAQVQVGQTYAGDGMNVDVGVDQGARLGRDGYLHISGDFRHQQHIDRGADDARTGTHSNLAFAEPESTRESLAIEAGEQVTSGIELYGNLTYAHRHGEVFENYRLPSVLPEVFPGGFTPTETIEENDYQATVGLRGDDLFGFKWDLSTAYGSDVDNVGIYNSANVDLYHATGFTPTKFNVINYSNGQWTNNLDLSRDINLPILRHPVHLAFGAEHRYENYKLGAGEPGTYYGSGTQSLVGLRPGDAGNHSRDVYAGYVDLETKVTDKLDIDLAGRYESYTDAGSIETGKLSARYDFTPRLAVRATISNGFRAPTLAEENYTNIAVSPTYATGQVAVNSVAARALGARPLKPERSTNLDAGIVAEPVHNLHVAVDVYQIDIRDRIIEGGTYKGPDALAALESQGISLPANLDPNTVGAQFFQNGASTRTQGLDLTANYPTSLGRFGHVVWNGAIDLNRTTIRHISDDQNGNPLLNAQDVGYLTTASPRSKIILSAFWKLGRYDATLRETRWGQVKDQMTYQEGPNYQSNSVFYPFTAKPRFITDLELGVQITPGVHFAIGANNLLNTHPTRIPAETRYLGVPVYDDVVSQVGIDGGFYYGRVNLSF